MLRSKYNNILTIILVCIVAILLIVGIVLLVKWVKQTNIDKSNEQVISQWAENHQDNEIENNAEEQNIVIPELQNVNTNNQSQSSGTAKKKTYLDGFVVVGYIQIPKTGVKYAILETSSIKALETAVAVAYPSNPKLNTKGNVVIQGHNYRNGKFFSNNKKLEIGDKIKITDDKNKTLTYTIYEKFETTAEDAAYFTRDTGDNIEISLSTCTDDGNNRLVILAKVL